MLLFQFGVLAIYVAVGLAYEDAGPITIHAKVHSDEAKCYGPMCQINRTTDADGFQESATYEMQPEIFFDIGNLSIYANFKTIAAHLPFFNGPHESVDGKIKELLDQQFNPDAVNSIFEFVHTGIIHINYTNAKYILKAAKFLQLQHTVTACVEFLKGRMQVHDVVDYIRNKDLKGVPQLKLAAYRYMEDNFAEFSVNSELVDLSPAEFLTILRSNEIRNTSEEQVFEAAMRWIQYNPNERKAYLYQIMENIRLPLLSYEYLSQYVMPQFLNKSHIHVRQLINDAIDCHVFPEYRTNQGCNMSPRNGTTKFLVLLLTSPGANMQIYDPVSYQLKNISKLPSKYHYSAVVNNFNAYVIGGISPNQNRLKSVDVYDPKSDSWEGIEPMIEAREYPSAAVVRGIIYVCGGNGDNPGTNKSMESYNWRTKTWTQLSSMSIGRKEHRLLVVGNYLYAIGGYEPHERSVEMYNIEQNFWTTMKPMKTGRGDFGAVVYDEKIYVCGGDDTYNRAEVFDTKTNTWSPIANMLKEAHYFSLQAYNGLLWAFTSSVSSMDVYDPENQDWTMISNYSQHFYSESLLISV